MMPSKTTHEKAAGGDANGVSLENMAQEGSVLERRSRHTMKLDVKFAQHLSSITSQANKHKQAKLDAQKDLESKLQTIDGDEKHALTKKFRLQPLYARILESQAELQKLITEQKIGHLNPGDSPQLAQSDIDNLDSLPLYLETALLSELVYQEDAIHHIDGQDVDLTECMLNGWPPILGYV